MTDPHVRPETTPSALWRSVWRHRQLIGQMVRREVTGRYRGSVLGLAWSFFNPMLMLAVYTFVFSVVFKARWGGVADESRAGFAIALFIGMILYGLFAEVVTRAPSLVVNNTNYVKKVVFPLEILPVVCLGAAMFHAAVSILVLLTTMVLVNGGLSATAVYFPIVLFPLLAATVGVAWFLASLGVFVRDTGQTVGIITTVVMFLSPVFYPASSLPEPFRIWMMVNPLAFIIEQGRAVLIGGLTPDWVGLFWHGIASALLAWAGFWWFQRTRKGFADVL